MLKNFLTGLISRFAPEVFKPIPTGLLYILLQAISREIGGECPWDTAEECYRGYAAYWKNRCRNTACPGFRHYTGLVGYDSYVSDVDEVSGIAEAASSTVMLIGTSNFTTLGVGIGSKVLKVTGEDIDGESVVSFVSTSVTTDDTLNFSALTNGQTFAGGAATYKVLTTRTAAVGNTFKWSSFRQGTSDDFVRVGTKGVYFKIDLANSSNIVVGDKWTILCVASTGFICQPIPDVTNTGSYGAVAIDSAYKYTGNKDAIYTVEITRFDGYYQNFEDALLQINLATSTGTWLDYWGAYFGIKRMIVLSTDVFEEDEMYRIRMLKEITGAKCTKAVLLETAKNFYASDFVTITEYAKGVSVPPDGYNSALKLWPYQFYINPPPEDAPSAKFIKSGSNFLVTVGSSVVPSGTAYVYTYDTVTGYSLRTNVSTEDASGDYLFISPVEAGDCLYLCNDHVFSGVHTTLIAGMDAWTSLLEYWDGSNWATLLNTDTTLGFWASGVIYWNIPDDWEKSDPPAIGTSFYWVRLRVVVPPVDPNSSAYADFIQLSYAGSTCRGNYCGHVDTYDPDNRDSNNCYLYSKTGWQKPVAGEFTLQQLLDRQKVAGTIALINH